MAVWPDRQDALPARSRIVLVLSIGMLSIGSPSGTGDDVRRRATLWASPALAWFSQSGFLVYVLAVANLVDNNHPFLAKSLIDYAVVSLATLEQTSQIACQRLGRDFFKVFSQPTNSIHDAAGDGRVNPFQLPAGGFEDARSVHTTPAVDAA